MISKLRLLAVLLCVCFVALPVFAASTGDISGTVTDPTGAVVSGASVTVKNLATGAIRTVVTNEYGQFSVPQLELGSYQVKIEKTGFKSLTESAVVKTGENTRLSMQMSLGTSTEVVEVTGSNVTLDVATAQVSDSLSTVEIQSLPNQARDPVAYATLSPGTVPVSKDNPFLGTGSYNSNGSRGRANNIVVDNLISSDISTTGESGNGTFSYDGVQEFKLITNNFDAEFGRNSGSQVQIVTKGGTNHFHGSIYEFHQNNFFNARDFFNTTTDAGGNTIPGPTTKFVQNQGGFTAGGPIWKDHTFIFGHWEIDKTRGAGSTSIASVLTPTQVAGIVNPTSLSLFQAVGSPNSASGTLANSAPNQDNGHSWSARLDQNLRHGKDSIFVRYGRNPDIATSPGLTFVSSNLPGFGAQFTGVSHNFSSGYTMTPTVNTVNQVRLGWSKAKAQFDAQSPFALGPQINIGGIDSFGESNIIPQGRTQNVWQYGDTFSWVKGRHTFKFGFDGINYNSPSVFDANVRGTFTFLTVADFQNGNPFSFTQRAGNTDRTNDALDLFGFVQDDFRLTSTITLNLGFRLESSGGVTEEKNLLSNLNPNNVTPIGALGLGVLGGIDLGGQAFHRNYNPAPRIGMAWNPNRGKLVFRGGYGVAYDYIFLNPITNLRFAPPFVQSLTITSFTGGDTFANVVAGNSATQQAAVASVGQFPSTFKNFGSLSAVNQNLDNPRNQQYSAGVEYQVLPKLTLKSSYIGTRNDHLQVTMPLNFTNPLLRPAASADAADQLARLTAIRTFIAQETGSATGANNNRIDPRFNAVTQVQSIGTSNYNALQLEAVGKFTNLSFNANYTWSHSIDDVSDVLGVLVNDSATIANPNLPLSANRANSQFDLRHRINLSYSYSIPFARSLGNPVLRKILDGWTTSGIFSTQTGLPVTLFAGALRTPGSGSTIADPLGLGAGTAWVNGDATQVHPSAFTPDTSAVSQPLFGHQGTSGRNHLRLDGLTDFDMAIAKQIPIIKEGYALQLRWEVFNVLNHPNMSGFVNTFTSGIFGSYTSTATNMRQMQVAARFQF